MGRLNDSSGYQGFPPVEAREAQSSATSGLTFDEIVAYTVAQRMVEKEKDERQPVTQEWKQLRFHTIKSKRLNRADLPLPDLAETAALVDRMKFRVIQALNEKKNRTTTSLRRYVP